ncbi:MAG TPA: isoprenylcysteine carboxylmethyltransferase family protein [Vicinamibacterales bacterium]|jgi:protein-S-isoprenylcysteine O-methyltransferase Ste14|nr:isoprenylcysteine carboxylmethyltransferase family protein [Vicinamibacterales bacterium]
MAPRSDNPGVWFPPPLWYLLAVLVGVLLNRRWPLPVAESPLTIVAGICFVAGWMALAFASIGRFRRSKTTIVPIRPAEALVLSGPYRYTRNPMYVSLALLTIACGLLLETWWPIVLLVPALALVQRFVILREERYLRRRFGAEYEAYARRVRRWL